MLKLFMAAMLGALVVKMFGAKDRAEAMFFFVLTAAIGTVLALLLCA